ncbi:hypothetical protein E9232_006855 [Inquilinus ginsengisoli]|uniref:Uncharacterized protein n=1 Tax=Inquilinus ginsengisoli TaxID=363840 RepID=A0ABU1K0B0_9PROT|nr:hypothetical protein [Inquilinus ginsengisoli]MDR6294301.1 hypothetical protein [Inquilinus ginsengisoli]
MPTAAEARAWIEEGDGLLASARVMRATWLWRKRRFSASVSLGDRPRSRAWIELLGLPRSSCLLLGYSVEMYLKAGIAKLYRNCRQEMFSRDVKKIYGHNLDEMAEEICLPLTGARRSDLKLMKEFILFEARYPLQIKPGMRFPDAINKRTDKIWGNEQFRRLCALSRDIQIYVSKLDQNRANPASVSRLEVDKDGYVAFRFGGGLPTRITYRPSSHRSTRGEIWAEDAQALVMASVHPAIWDTFLSHASILHDGDDKTCLLYVRI